MILVAIYYVVLIAAGYAASFVATGLSVKLAERHGIHAQVDHRSSHTRPTPRVGGIGVFVPFLLLMFALQAAIPFVTSLKTNDEPVLISPEFSGLQLLILAATVGGAFVLGLLDDISGMPALVKLSGQLFLAALPAVLGVRLAEFDLPGGIRFSLPAWAGIGITIAWIALMMNVVNFMDGINGLAGRYGEFVGLCLVVAFGTTRTHTHFAALAAVLVGCCGGFLRWNLPEARTFLGDCGSQALGAFAAVITLFVATTPRLLNNGQERAVDFFPAIILMSPMIFDVVLTLFRRLLAGENILRPHRQHLYQRFLLAHLGMHDAPLALVESLLFLNAIAAFLYWRRMAGGLDLVATAACIASLAYYFIRVTLAELRTHSRIA